MIIYHNPRCSKSRETLKLIREKGIEPEIHDYIQHPLSADEIRDILDILNIKPLDLVRTNETVWKEFYAGKDCTYNQIVGAMAKNPILIQRPIIIKGRKGVLGRPPENVLDLL